MLSVATASALFAAQAAPGLPLYESNGSTHYQVTTSGELLGWGEVRKSTFGTPDTAAFYWSPGFLADSVAAVWTYNGTTLLLKEDGTLWAFGEDSIGWYSQAHTDVTQPVQIAAGVVDADISISHILFLKDDGSLWGIGEFDDGELGAASFGQGVPRPTYLEPAYLADNVVGFAAGSDSSYFFKNDGSLWGVGKNRVLDDESGQAVSALGLSDATTLTFKTPQLITQGVVAVDAGNDFALILKDDLSLWATGNAAYGAAGVLGGGSSSLRKLHEAVEWIDVDVTHTSDDETYSTVALLKTDGSVWVQGYFYLDEPLPVSIREPLKVYEQAVDIEAASGAVIFVHPDGRAMGIGSGLTGVLGADFGGFTADLVEVASGVSRIWSAPTAGGALIVEFSNGSVWAYGESSSNRFGSPLQVGVSPNILKIASGSIKKAGSAKDVGVLLYEDGSLWAAGRLGFGSSNIFTQLADGVTDFTISLATIYFTSTDKRLFSVNFGMAPRQETTDVIRIWSEAYYPAFMTFAEKEDKSILSFGTPGPIHETPSFRLQGSNLADKASNLISANVISYTQTPSGSGVIFLKSDGTAWSLSGTGNSFGEFGVGDTDYVGEPTLISSGVVDVGFSSGASYLLKQDGVLLGAGLGDNGQLGAAIPFVATQPVALTPFGVTPADALGGVAMEENWVWSPSLFYVSTHYWPWAWSTAYGWLYVMDSEQPIGHGKYFYSYLLEGWTYFPATMPEWFYLWNVDGEGWSYLYEPWMAVYRVSDGVPEFFLILTP